MQPIPDNGDFRRDYSVMLDFSGMELAPSALPWGQGFMRERIRRIEPVDQHLNQILIQPVPVGADIEGVFQALTTLLSSHESFRTKYDFDQYGHATQELDGQGRQVVNVYDIDESKLEGWISAVKKELRDQHYDLKQGPLLRIAVATTKFQPRFISIGLSHMVADGSGMRIIREELAELLDPTRNLHETPIASWQPSDQLRYEQTRGAQHIGERSLQYHTTQFRRFPSTMFWRQRSKAENPRYRSGTLHSSALLPAVASIHKAHEVTPSSTIFATFSLVIGEITKHCTNSMFLICSNRNSRNLHSVANYSQTVPIIVDLHSESFWSLLKSVHKSMLIAYRYASYPPKRQLEVKRSVEYSRGIKILEDCVYNPQWWISESELQANSEFDPWINEMHINSSTFTWNEGADRGLALYFGVKPNAITLTADTKFFAPEDFEPTLRRIESLLIRGAKEDFNPSVNIDACRLTRVNSEWIFIDRCWVNLNATRKLVAEAALTEGVEVTVVSEPKGRKVLSAHIADSVLGIEEIREKCWEALPKWRNAMIPHRIAVFDAHRR